MEFSNRFQGFVGKTFASGSKPSTSMFPTLKLTATKDKFQLDKKAQALIGVAEGDYVAFLDINLGEVATTELNNRWFITKGYKKSEDAPMQGAKIGKNGIFSYAGIYGAIQLGLPEVTEASAKDLVAQKKGEFYETPGEKEAFIAYNKIQYRLERLIETDGEGNVTDVFEVATGVKQPVYALVAREEIPHDRDEKEEDTTPQE